MPPKNRQQKKDQIFVIHTIYSKLHLYVRETSWKSFFVDWNWNAVDWIQSSYCICQFPHCVVLLNADLVYWKNIRSWSAWYNNFDLVTYILEGIFICSSPGTARNFHLLINTRKTFETFFEIFFCSIIEKVLEVYPITTSKKQNNFNHFRSIFFPSKWNFCHTSSYLTQKSTKKKDWNKNQLCL